MTGTFACNSARIEATPEGGGTPLGGLTSKTPECTGVQVASADSRPTHRRSEHASAGDR